jgi:glycosyltransferase involved in cell wall biosynthesis
MGVEGDKGVFRELRLTPEGAENTVLGHSYAATYSHERFNAGCLDYRIRRFKPDVVYAWNMRGVSKTLLFRMHRKDIRVVYDLHSDWMLPEQFHTDPWYRWWKVNPSFRSKLYRFMGRMVGRAGRVIGMLPIDDPKYLNIENSYVVSNWLKEELKEAGMPSAEELPVFYPTININKLLMKKDYEQRNRFAWAGLLNDSKAPDIAVDAIGLLKERGVDVELDLFGMGQPSERKAMRERIQLAGLSDRITMQGIRPGEMSQHYKNYDALLYTNRHAEPFSMTVLEAMLSGLPCLVSKVGGNREILEDGVNAFLVEPNDAEALADSIVRFIDLEDHGRSLAMHDIESLQETHSIDNFCQSIEAILSPSS